MQKRTDGVADADGGKSEGLDCAAVRDQLPVQLSRAFSGPSGTAESEVRAHLEGCAGCRAEAAFLERLRVARPEPPASLAPNVLDRLDAARRDARRPVRVAWGLSAAAVVVLALGVGVLWTGDSAQESVWSLALDHPSAVWHDDDWVVAGEPVLEALSDDALRTLLREMEP